MFGNCIRAGAASGNAVSIVWRDKNGALKAQGASELCSPDPAVWVEPGDRIAATDGSATRNYVVPDLTMAVDRVSDTVSGTGPAGRTLNLCPWWRFSDYVRCHAVRIGQDGVWSWESNGGIDGALVDVSWRSPNGDRLTMSAHAPTLAVTLGKPSFEGYSGVPRGVVNVAINSGSSATGHVISDQYGAFKGKLVDSHGSGVRTTIGDQVSGSIASDASWVTSAVEGSADKSTELVSGRCVPGGDTWTPYVGASISHSGRFRAFAPGYTEEDGRFTIDFKDKPPFGGYLNIRSGDHITIACRQSTGDLTQFTFRVP